VLKGVASLEEINRSWDMCLVLDYNEWLDALEEAAEE
jgi:hypothetical protein